MGFVPSIVPIKGTVITEIINRHEPETISETGCYMATQLYESLAIRNRKYVTPLQ